MRRIQLPVVALQGMWLRSTIKPDPPAAGPSTGTVQTASHPPLRVAVVGDSTAAGCGVASHDEGFAGCLARELAASTGRSVEWHAAGQFGATARRVRHRLLPQLGTGLDAAVLLAGANDVMTGRHPEHWREDLTAIADGLTERARRVVITGIPPFALFPAMPATLGRYLSERAAAFDEVSRQVCAARPATTWVTMTGTPGPDFFAADRFHPSAAGYRRWARVIAAQLAH